MTNLTLEKVAELAGVSRSTVSRVVNNQPGVREGVRRRVWQVITETGYRPNLAARALASNRTGIITLVVPHTYSRLFNDPFFSRLTKGITLACSTQDVSLTMFLFHSEAEEAKLTRSIAYASLFDGVIMASFQFEDPLVPHLIKNEVPLVVIGRQDRYPEVSFVDVDNINGSYLATTHLLRLGYQRVAHIAGPQSMVAGNDRLAGYCKALEDRGRPYQAELVVEADFTKAGGYTAMHQLLDVHPDAVFAASDLTALGAWRAVSDAGLCVPQDIAIVGFDDLLPVGEDHVQLTTVRQPVDRIGREAVDVLLDILQNGPVPRRRVIFDTELVIRESCGAKLHAH